MTDQFKAATIRGLYGGLLAAALVFLTTLQLADVRTANVVGDASIAAGVALISYMISRGVAEGLIDSNREPTSADVGRPPPLT